MVSNTMMPARNWNKAIKQKYQPKNLFGDKVSTYDLDLIDSYKITEEE